MIFGRYTMSLLAAAMSLAEPAQGAPHQIFKPTGPWAMEYADQTCRLIRNFSDGNGVVTLAFEKMALGAGLSLGLAGKALRTPSTVPMARFRYNGDKSARASALVKTVLTDGRDSFIVTDVPFVPIDRMGMILRKHKPADRFEAMNSAEMAAASGATSITLTYGFIDEPTFEIGPMAAPLKAMRTCVDDLVKSWGVDPQRMATMTRLADPLNSPRNWLSIEDYPDEMWHEHKGGIVPVRLVVDEYGVAQDCVVMIEPRGPFEEAVCKGISKRARFKPALDADGKPMRSYWTRVVNFLPW